MRPLVTPGNIPYLYVMKNLTTLFALIVSCSMLGQTNPEFNPDYDGNGFIGVDDILGVLGYYDTPWPTPPAWSCGDPVSYQGYDYATVLIGSQCWFAENLRSENYTNGEAIPAGLSSSEWSAASFGALTVYEDAQGNDFYLPNLGRLYNWYAVDDARGLCPSGWHVPSDTNWMTMEMALGMSQAEAEGAGWRGTDQGTQMKTDDGWWMNGFGDGTNSSGFSGRPGGFRGQNGYEFDFAGVAGFWWCSPSDAPNSRRYRYLFHDYESVGRTEIGDPQYGLYGLSVRCIQD